MKNYIYINDVKVLKSDVVDVSSINVKQRTVINRSSGFQTSKHIYTFVVYLKNGVRLNAKYIDNKHQMFKEFTAVNEAYNENRGRSVL